MTERFEIHPQNPQPRLVREVVKHLREGALIAYPTDSCYAFGFRLGNLQAARDTTRIRRTGKDHNFTLVCSDLSEIATYARMDNWAYRLLKAHTPGPYTFILPATRDVPRRFQNAKKRTIGIRVPAHPVPEAILSELGEPLMSSTLMLPGEDLPLNDPAEIFERLDGELDVVIDSGSCGIVPTTVVDLTGDFPAVIRVGKGDDRHFQ